MQSCTQELAHQTRLAGLPVARLPPWLLRVLAKLPGAWGRAGKVWPSLLDMWARRSSDDLAFLMMLALDSFVTAVPSTRVNQGDARALVDMCTKCRKQIVECVRDPQCKAALDGLAECGLNDQVRLCRTAGGTNTVSLQIWQLSQPQSTRVVHQASGSNPACRHVGGTCCMLLFHEH